MQSNDNLQQKPTNQKEIEKSWLCLNLDKKAFINSFPIGFNFQKQYFADVYLGDQRRIRWQGVDSENGSFWVEGKKSIDNITSQEFVISDPKKSSLPEFITYLNTLNPQDLKNSKLLFKERISTLITTPDLNGQAIEGKIEFDKYLPIEKIYPGFIPPRSFILDANSEVNNICKIDIEIINSGENSGKNSGQVIESIFEILRLNIQRNFPRDTNPQLFPAFYELTGYEHLVQNYESLKKEVVSELKIESKSELKTQKLVELFYKANRLEHNLVYLMKYGGENEQFKMAFLRITNPKIYEAELQKFLKEQKEKDRKEFKFEKIPGGF